jgi:hypothetical protein
MHWNANTGHHTIESKEPLKPLVVRLEAPNRIVDLNGTVLTITESHEEIGSLEETIESLYFVLPSLLAVRFADPPILERVEGTVGEVPFRWELAEWTGTYWTTTQEVQEKAFADSFERLSMLSELPDRRRMVGALHYFHVARRLLVVGAAPGEFLSEAILNFAKVLETLFPPASEKGTIDAARKGLAGLGYDTAAIESRFIPAISLRNRIDVGHGDLTLFNRHQLAVIHAYTEAAEGFFKELLSTVLQRLANGAVVLAPIATSSPSAEDLRVIARIESTLKPGAA